VQISDGVRSCCHVNAAVFGCSFSVSDSLLLLLAEETVSEVASDEKFSKQITESKPSGTLSEFSKEQSVAFL